MKTKILAMAGAVLLSIIGAGVCGAQSRTLEVNVPFAFEVGNKTMPAGSYRVETVLTGNGSLQMLRSNSGKRDDDFDDGCRQGQRNTGSVIGLPPIWRSLLPGSDPDWWRIRA